MKSLCNGIWTGQDRKLYPYIYVTIITQLFKNNGSIILHYIITPILSLLISGVRRSLCGLLGQQEVKMRNVPEDVRCPYMDLTHAHAHTQINDSYLLGIMETVYVHSIIDTNGEVC